MKTRAISTEEQFLEIKETWNRIYSKMQDGTPFQSWEWSHAWLQRLPEENGQLFVLEVYEEKEIYGYAPLVITEKAIRFLGDVHFDYGMFICAERKNEVFQVCMDRIVEEARKRKRNVELDCIPVGCDQFSLFQETARQYRTAMFAEQVDTANIHLGEYYGLEGYTKAISSSLRKKAIKPCVRAGVTFAVSDFSDELWEEIERVYTGRQDHRVGVSAVAWAKPIVKELCAAQLMQIAKLEHNGEITAFTMLLNRDKTYYFWITACKSDADSLSYGHFLRYSLISQAYAKGIETVDLMRGAYAYKKQWDCNITYNYEFKLFRNILQKGQYILFGRVRKFLRDLIYGNGILKGLYKKIRDRAGV